MKAIIFHNELIQIGLRPFWKENTGPKDGTKPNPLTFSGSGNLTAAIGKSACRRGPLDFVVSARNIF